MSTEKRTLGGSFGSPAASTAGQSPSALTRPEPRSEVRALAPAAHGGDAPEGVLDLQQGENGIHRVSNPFSERAASLLLSQISDCARDSTLLRAPFGVKRQRVRVIVGEMQQCDIGRGADALRRQRDEQQEEDFHEAIWSAAAMPPLCRRRIKSGGMAAALQSFAWLRMTSARDDAHERVQVS